MEIRIVEVFFLRANKMPKCTVTWLTVSTGIFHTNTVWTNVCHQHITIGSNDFWRERWRSIRNYLRMHPRVQHIIMTDTDIHTNPSHNVLERFRRIVSQSNRSIVVSTEDTCWIGRICSISDALRFQSANLSTSGKFMHSQFMGNRDAVLFMLNWGLQQDERDDMRMIFDFILAHPSMVTLDEQYEIFGSLAFAQPHVDGTYICWGGERCRVRMHTSTCRKHGDSICIGSACPIAWHANGPLSDAFLKKNSHCSRLFRFHAKFKTHLRPFFDTKASARGNQFSNVLTASQETAFYDLVRYFTTTCEKIGVEYLLDGGSLIGSMLHHDRIPWDDDFDVYVRKSDKSAIEAALTNGPHIARSVGLYSKLWSRTHHRVPNGKSWNWPFVDIGWLITNATHAWEQRSSETRYRRHIYPIDWLFPSVRRPFGPFVLRAPHSSRQLLQYRYGNQWDTRCVAHHWDHRLEKWRFPPTPDEVTSTNCNLLAVARVERSSQGPHHLVETLMDVNGDAIHRVIFVNGSMAQQSGVQQ